MWNPIIPVVQRNRARIEAIHKTAVQGAVEKPHIPRFVATHPVADDVDQEWVGAKNDNVGHEILGGAAVGAVHPVAIAPEDAFDDV